MDTKRLMKEFMEFNKSAFDSAFDALVSIQDQGEKLANSIMDDAKWFPEEGQKHINEVITALNKGRDALKKAMDEQYAKGRLEPGQALQRIIQLNRTTLDKTFKTVAKVQDHTAKMAESVQKHTEWLTPEKSAALQEWTAAIQAGRDQFQKSVDDSFAKLEAAFGKKSPSAAEPSTKAQSKENGE